jgi:hypothetical protein
MTEYSKRGKHNPFDSYMSGFAPWITPRQIILIEEMCKKFIVTLNGIEYEAFVDFKEQIDHEAAIKRKKYLGEA